MGRNRIVNREDASARYKAFATLSYLEDSESKAHIVNLIMSNIADYIVWSVHNRDESKEHRHCIFHLKSAMTISALSKRIGIPERFIQPCKKGDDLQDINALKKYLIHADTKSKREGKSAYPIESIVGPDEKDCREYVVKYLKNNQSKKHEDDKDILRIIEFIESMDSEITTKELTRWCCMNGLYSVQRRAGYIVRDILIEHNKAVEYYNSVAYRTSLSARISEAYTPKEINRRAVEEGLSWGNPLAQKRDIESGRIIEVPRDKYEKFYEKYSENPDSYDEDVKKMMKMINEIKNSA